MKKKRLKLPDTAAFFMIMILIAAILTYMIPAGSFERIVDGTTGRTLVVDGTYSPIDGGGVSIGQVLSSLFRGMVGGVDIIAFIFVVGGCFGIINATGAFESGLSTLMRRLSGKEGLLIGTIMAALAVCGATFGMGEEALPFVTVMIAASQKMKMGRITGIAIIVVGIYSGYTAGPLNPFNTGIGQEIAELPIFSGMGLRAVLMAGTVAIGIHHVIVNGKKYRSELTPLAENTAGQAEILPGTAELQTDGLSPEVSEKCDAAGEDAGADSLSGKQKIVLLIVLGTIIVMVICIMMFGWYFEEISALFVAMGIAAGMFYFRSLDETGKAFVKGAGEMTTAVIYFTFARAILVIMEDGQIMDTVVYALSVPLSQAGGVLATWGIFICEGIINFFIPSSSGQAAAVMPILTPLADIVGVTRQTAVLAYQCGGFLNLITPTQMVVLAACALGGVSFAEWFRYSWKLVLKWCLWAMVILAVATMTGYGPF